MTISLLNRSDQANCDRFPIEKPSSCVRIISANVAGLDHQGLDLEKWKASFTKTAGIFKRYKPDVLALQEVNTFYLTSLQQKVDISYAICGSLCYIDKNRNLIYSREYNDHIKEKKNLTNTPFDSSDYTPILYNADAMTCRDSGFYPLETTPTAPTPISTSLPSNCEVRTVTWVILQHKDTNKLWLIQNAHFDSNKQSAFSQCVETVTRETTRLVERVSSEDRKILTVVFTGDLNLFPAFKGKQNRGDVVYNQLIESFTDVRDLADHHFGPDGTFVGKSTPKYRFTGNPYTPSRSPKNLIERLDHMFVQTTGVKVVNEAVIADNPCLDKLDENPFPLHRPPNTGNANTDSPSDHYFIAVDFAPKEDLLPEEIASLDINQ